MEFGFPRGGILGPSDWCAGQDDQSYGRDRCSIGRDAGDHCLSHSAKQPTHAIDIIVTYGRGFVIFVNSTLFQDCNYGSALLGLLELAASQGATVKGLYGLALAANSFWFPDNYVKTALYFSLFHNEAWNDVDRSWFSGRSFRLYPAGRKTSMIARLPSGKQ